MATAGAVVLGLGAQLAAGAVGARKMADQTQALLEARAAGNAQAARQAAVNAARMQMTMQVSGAFGSTAPQLPSAVESVLTPDPGAGAVPFELPPAITPDLSMDALQRNYYRGY